MICYSLRAVAGSTFDLSLTTKKKVMKAIIFRSSLFIAVMAIGLTTMAQNSNTKSLSNKNTVMKTYLIERDIPGAGKLTPAELKAISQKSCGVLNEMGPKIKWLQSYVSGDRITCIYQAENEELVREHARKGGFPANKITEIGTTISPATAKD
jgi:hypothetical protein